MLPYARHLKQPARALRASLTDAEVALWQRLRGKQVHGAVFNRQKPLGPFIVDFYCAAAWLVIEVDGGQHYSDQGLAADAERDAYLSGLEMLVLRFSNHDVLTNLEGVVEAIATVVAQRR